MTQHDHDREPDAVAQRFQPTSGRLTGTIGLICAAVMLVFSVADWDAGAPLGVAIFAVLAGVVIWAAMLRPAIWVTGRELVLRGMFHTDHVPLAAIDSVHVTQVLTATVGERRFESPAVGYTVRQTIRGRNRSKGPEMSQESAANTHQAYVEARVSHLAKEAREVAGIRRGSPEQEALAAQVRRTWSWPLIGAAAALAVLFLVWLVVDLVA